MKRPRSRTRRRWVWALCGALVTVFGVGVGPASAQPDPVVPVVDEAECGITDVGACVSEGIASFFRVLVVGALNPLLRLVGATLLATPRLDQFPRIAELWESSRQIAVVSYVLLVTVAGVVLMAYETVQTRTTVREVAPRIVVGFLAANMSLLLAGKAIEFANAVSYALVADGVEPDAAARQLAGMFATLVVGSVTGGSIFTQLIGLGIVVLLVALVCTYVQRLAATAILLAGAPLFLIMHGLPQTDGIARWWWRAFGAVLGIQIGQSLVLIVGLRVLLDDGGFVLFFGPTSDSIANLLVTGVLLWILVKIPKWAMSHVQFGGGGRTFLGSLVRGFIAYKTLGVLRGGRGGRPAAVGGRRPTSPPDPVDPYSRTTTTSSGQYILPLPGITPRRGAARRAAEPAAEPAPRGPGRGQLSLPFEKGWPSDRPVLTRSGQYRLPIDVRRAPAPRTATGTPAPVTPKRRTGRQLELPFDPYRGGRPNRDGQYVLPLDVQRVAKPAPPPTPAPARPASRPARQPQLPFDPFAGQRPQRDGQYALPFDDLTRVKARPAASTPPPPRRSRGQLRLPLDLKPREDKTP